MGSRTKAATTQSIYWVIYSTSHGRVFWAGVRNIYTPEFAARIGGGMTGDADEFALGWLKAIGQGKARGDWKSRS